MTILIFFGVLVLIIGISVWFMLSTPQGALTQVMYGTPAERMDFADTVQSLKLIYFLVVFGVGIGTIIWGSQS